MIVYLTTNLINGKKYIGKDSLDKKSYLGSGKILKQAIKKYGKENFKKEVLCKCNSLIELEQIEKYLIAYYNADKDGKYYNITKGGSGGKTHNQKKKKVYQYDLEGNFIREWESATEASFVIQGKRCNIVAACSKRISYRKFLWRRTKEKNVSRKEKTYARKKVILIDKNSKERKQFISVKELCIFLKIEKSCFYRRLKSGTLNFEIEYCK